MPKLDVNLLILHEFKYKHNALEAAANIDRAKGDGSKMIGEY